MNGLRVPSSDSDRGCDGARRSLDRRGGKALVAENNNNLLPFAVTYSDPEEQV